MLLAPKVCAQKAAAFCENFTVEQSRFISTAIKALRLSPLRKMGESIDKDTLSRLRLIPIYLPKAPIHSLNKHFNAKIHFMEMRFN